MPPVQFSNDDTWVLAGTPASVTMAYLGKGGGNHSVYIKHGGSWPQIYFLQIQS